jgi:hypothetical protein
MLSTIISVDMPLPISLLRGGQQEARGFRSHRTCSLLFLLLLFLLLAASAEAKPCPSNAFFLYSAHHQKSVCACARGLVCVGSECLTGHPDNYGTFSKPDMAGFPIHCTDCTCDDFQGREPDKFSWAELVGGTKMRDFIDPLFDKRCSVVPGPHVEPRALPQLNWLHFPK